MRLDHLRRGGKDLLNPKAAEKKKVAVCDDALSQFLPEHVRNRLQSSAWSQISQQEIYRARTGILSLGSRAQGVQMLEDVRPPPREQFVLKRPAKSSGAGGSIQMTAFNMKEQSFKETTGRIVTPEIRTQLLEEAKADMLDPVKKRAYADAYQADVKRRREDGCIAIVAKAKATALAQRATVFRPAFGVLGDVNLPCKPADFREDFQKRCNGRMPSDGEVYENRDHIVFPEDTREDLKGIKGSFGYFHFFLPPAPLHPSRPPHPTPTRPPRYA